MGKRTVSCKFPVARIKKIMQADEDVGKVAQATPILVSKALEQFLQSLVESTLAETQAQGSRKMTAYHLKRTIHQNETFDFLKDIVERVEDPVEPEVGSSSTAGRRGSRLSGGAASSEPRAKRRKGEDGTVAESSGSGSGSGVKDEAAQAAASWSAPPPAWNAAPNPNLTPFLAGPVKPYDEDEEEDSDE